MDKKTILLFMDLEGTLLSEETGKIRRDDFKRLLDEIDRLQRITGAQVSINLISPIQLDLMIGVVDRLNYYISSFNREKRSNIRDIQSATATFPREIIDEECFSNSVIEPFPKGAEIEDLGGTGKRKYVNDWYKYFEDRSNLLFCIYAGNGRNDFQAMKFLKEKKRKNKTICPKNSRRVVKAIADYIGETTDIDGVIAGLKKINDSLEKEKLEQDGRVD